MNKKPKVKYSTTLFVSGAIFLILGILIFSSSSHAKDYGNGIADWFFGIVFIIVAIFFFIRGAIQLKKDNESV